MKSMLMVLETRIAFQLKHYQTMTLIFMSVMLAKMILKRLILLLAVMLVEIMVGIIKKVVFISLLTQMDQPLLVKLHQRMKSYLR